MIEEVFGLTLYTISSNGELKNRGVIEDVMEAEYQDSCWWLKVFNCEKSLFPISCLAKMLNGEVVDDFFFAEKVHPINLVLARESEKAKWRKRWWEIYLENYKHGSQETIIQDTDKAIVRAINGSYSFFKDAGEKHL